MNPPPTNTQRPPRSLEIPEPLLPIERSVLEIIRIAFGVKNLFSGDIPSLAELHALEAARLYNLNYGRAPAPGQDVADSLGADDRKRVLQNATAFRRKGYVFARVGHAWVGFAESVFNALHEGDSPLGSPAETALIYLVSEACRSLRRGGGLEFAVDLERLRAFYDPANKDPNGMARVRKALDVMAGFTFSVKYEDVSIRDVTPVLKRYLEKKDGTIVVTLNEYFLDSLVRLAKVRGQPDSKKRKEILKGISYAYTSPAALLVRNSPPRYSRTQRILQQAMFRSVRDTPPPHDRPQRAVHLGTVSKLLDTLGYPTGSWSSRIRLLDADLQRVVVEDAGGTVTPDIKTLLAMHGGDALKSRLTVMLPTRFFESEYARTIQKRSGLYLLGSAYDGVWDDASKLRAVSVVGFTGEDIRRDRLIYGITQAELAAEAGISKRMLIKYERGVSPIPHAVQQRLIDSTVRLALRRRTPSPCELQLIN